MTEGEDQEKVLEKRRVALRLELARSICHAYVHLARIIDFGAKAQSSANDDWSRVDQIQRFSALSRAEEDAVLIAFKPNQQVYSASK